MDGNPIFRKIMVYVEILNLSIELCQLAMVTMNGIQFKYNKIRGWEAGSVVKSIRYSSTGPGFNSQHQGGDSQQSVTPVLGM